MCVIKYNKELSTLSILKLQTHSQTVDGLVVYQIGNDTFMAEEMSAAECAQIERSKNRLPEKRLTQEELSKSLCLKKHRLLDTDRLASAYDVMSMHMLSEFAFFESPSKEVAFLLSYAALPSINMHLEKVAESFCINQHLHGTDAIPMQLLQGGSLDGIPKLGVAVLSFYFDLETQLIRRLSSRVLFESSEEEAFHGAEIKIDDFELDTTLTAEALLSSRLSDEFFVVSEIDEDNIGSFRPEALLKILSGLKSTEAQAEVCTSLSTFNFAKKFEEAGMLSDEVILPRDFLKKMRI